MPPHELENHDQVYKLIKENSNLKVEIERIKKEKAMLQLELRSTQEELNVIQEEHCKTEMFLKQHIKDLVDALAKQANTSVMKLSPSKDWGS